MPVGGRRSANRLYVFCCTVGDGYRHNKKHVRGLAASEITSSRRREETECNRGWSGSTHGGGGVTSDHAGTHGRESLVTHHLLLLTRPEKMRLFKHGILTAI